MSDVPEAEVEAAAVQRFIAELADEMAPDYPKIGVASLRAIVRRTYAAIRDSSLTTRLEAAEGVIEAAEEFVEVVGAFPGKPLGPKTKQRFIDTFVRLLAHYSAEVTKEAT